MREPLALAAPPLALLALLGPLLLLGLSTTAASASSGSSSASSSSKLATAQLSTELATLASEGDALRLWERATASAADAVVEALRRQDSSHTVELKGADLEVGAAFPCDLHFAALNECLCSHPDNSFRTAQCPMPALAFWARAGFGFQGLCALVCCCRSCHPPAHPVPHLAPFPRASPLLLYACRTGAAHLARPVSVPGAGGRWPALLVHGAGEGLGWPGLGRAGGAEVQVE